MFNPNPTITRLPIGEGRTALLIDNALAHPQQWVDRAVQHCALFQHAPHNAYPGIELGLDDGSAARVADHFRIYLCRALGARRLLKMQARLALVTTAPHALQPRQWFCHRDSAGLPPGQCMLASVLYLFHDPALGGTAFYQPLQADLETRLLVHDAGTLDAQAFSARYGQPGVQPGIQPGYMVASNAWFAQTAVVPARFNRLLVYDGGHFHTSHLTQPALLSDEPARGRLTMNGFFTCSRAAP